MNIDYKTDLMKIAIEEQRKCSEYPKVGSVIAKDGKVLSKGYRGEKPKIHAERVAIEKLSNEQLQGSTLFTTLEPCIKCENIEIEPCANLIIRSGIKKVVIGVLDPNGIIYSNGYKLLRENDIKVNFCDRDLYEIIEKTTFKYGPMNKLIGSGRCRVLVLNGGTDIDIQFSEKDTRQFQIKWGGLAMGQNGRQVYIYCYDGDKAVKEAAGVTDFSDITDPMVFRGGSHVITMIKGTIAIVKPQKATFYVLVKLEELFENYISFKYEVRNFP
jgi:diaminohydroxyphosphoribosylaminopyrimidine deaminase/5-amino-6-(5-phosphoribosylamino)uracil reductase